MRPCVFLSSSLALVALMVTLLPGQARADEKTEAKPTVQTPTAPSTPVAARGNKDTSAYLLGPEDVIEVSVRNFGELNHVVVIQPDGRINYPEIGEIDAAGKTPRDLAAKIQSELEKTRNNATVVVTVKEIHSRRIRIVGAVKLANVYDLKRNWRLLDVIAISGGLSTSKPDRVTGRIVRADATVIPLNIARAISSPDSPANVPLEPDDLILLEELDPIRNQANIIGQVGRPGAYEIDPETGVVSLLAQAGGPTNAAALTKAYVQRGTTQIPMNLRPAVVDGKNDDAVSKFRLKAGDVLYIPEIEKRYAVGGLVLRPGYFVYPEDGKLTVLQAFYQAGGLQQGGDQSKALIIRSLNGKPKPIPVNIEKMLKKSDLASNINLEPEDILYIPGRGKAGIGLNDALAPFSILSFLGLRIFR